jgi:hypothetical protein
MQRACLTLPVLPGRTDAAMGLIRSLAEERRTDYELLLRRLGVTRQSWFLAPGPCGDELVAYIECAAWASAFDELVRSRRPFDTWLRSSLAEVTGTDLADLPIGLPQPRLLFSYTAGSYEG